MDCGGAMLGKIQIKGERDISCVTNKVLDKWNTINSQLLSRSTIEGFNRLDTFVDDYELCQ